MDIDKYRAAVLDELENVTGWVDRSELRWLRENPDQPLGDVTIDGQFDFDSLFERLNK